MKKDFPVKKVLNKLEGLYFRQEELEREDITKSNPALWQLQDRILSIEYELEGLPAIALQSDFDGCFDYQLVERGDIHDDLQFCK